MATTPMRSNCFNRRAAALSKTSQSRWIDSICYEAMCGECYYQMGMLKDALLHFTAALEIFKAFPDWMAKVQFEANIRAAGQGAWKPVPWGRSARQNRDWGLYRTSELIAQGQIDMTDVVKRGGVVQQANYMSVNPQEIVRATCLALRRRAALLGPVAAFDPLNNEVLAAMSRQLAPPNHWTEAWANTERGLAMMASGKDEKALPLLQRAVLAGSEFDHPMTSIALLELGRLAMAKSNYSEAAKFFEEATFAAVNYPDYDVLEEAFRYRAMVHLLSNSNRILHALGTRRTMGQTEGAPPFAGPRFCSAPPKTISY